MKIEHKEIKFNPITGHVICSCSHLFTRKGFAIHKGMMSK